MPRICTPSSLHQAGAIAFALMLAGAALPAQAISVNDMVVWSASNKPLRMDIELVDLQGANLRNISLSVASAAEHSRVGLTRPKWADGVSFKVIVLDSGKVIARATSSQAIDTDFVNLLVSIRGSGIAQLQQVASKVSADGAEPLASPQAISVLAHSEKTSAPFADKPAARAVPSPVVIESRPVAPLPVPVAKPAPAAKAPPVAKPAPAPVVSPAPVAVPTPSAELVNAAQADNAEVLADVGAEPTLESLQAERTELLQQVTDLQARLTGLDQQIAALNPEAMPATETPTALAEAETSPGEPPAGKSLGYTYFSNIMLVLLGVFMSGMIGLDRMRASKR